MNTDKNNSTGQTEFAEIEVSWTRGESELNFRNILTCSSRLRKFIYTSDGRKWIQGVTYPDKYYLAKGKSGNSSNGNHYITRVPSVVEEAKLAIEKREQRWEEANARRKAYEELLASPMGVLAQKLLLNHLSEQEQIEYWLRLGPKKLAQIVKWVEESNSH